MDLASFHGIETNCLTSLHLEKRLRRSSSANLKSQSLSISASNASSLADTLHAEVAEQCDESVTIDEFEKVKEQLSQLQGLIDEKETEIHHLQHKLSEIEISKHSMSYGAIKNDSAKVLLYTSLEPYTFDAVVRIVEKFRPINYYAGWQVTLVPFVDQILMTLMKLKLVCRDLDLAHRFNTSRATVCNTVKTFVFAMHEIFLSELCAIIFHHS